MNRVASIATKTPERASRRERLQIGHLRCSDYMALVDGRITPGMARAISMIRNQEEGRVHDDATA